MITTHQDTLSGLYHISYSCSLSLGKWDQYPIGPSVLVDCFCRWTHPYTCGIVAVNSVDSLRSWQSQQGDSTNFAFSISNTDILSSVSSSRVSTYPSRNFLINGPASLANFGRKRRKKIHKSKKYWSYVKVGGFEVRLCRPTYLSKPGST